MTIDTELLASLPNLRLRADLVAQGALTGIHASPLLGQSVEFADHKEYAPGDDLKRLDWKVFGKSDRYYIRRFEQETEVMAAIAVDASGSMAYGSERMTKFDVAATFAAALSLILIRQQDPVSLFIASGNGLNILPAGTGGAHLKDLFSALEETRPEGKADRRELLSGMARCLKRHTQVFFLSDFFGGEPDNAISDMLPLKRLGHGLSFIHVLDRDEWEFPFEGPTRFVSMEESGLSLTALPDDLRESYLELIRTFAARTRSAALEHGCSYAEVIGPERLDEVIGAFIGGKSQRQRRHTVSAASLGTGSGGRP